MGPLGLWDISLHRQLWKNRFFRCGRVSKPLYLFDETENLYSIPILVCVSCSKNWTHTSHLPKIHHIISWSGGNRQSSVSGGDTTVLMFGCSVSAAQGGEDLRWFLRGEALIRCDSSPPNNKLFSMRKHGELVDSWIWFCLQTSETTPDMLWSWYDFNHANPANHLVSIN